MTPPNGSIPPDGWRRYAAGHAPETTHPTREQPGPHQQLSDTAPRDLQEESLRRVHTLPDVEVGWSAIGVPRATGFHLKPHATKGPAKAFQRGSEFGHLYPEHDGKERIRLRPRTAIPAARRSSASRSALAAGPRGWSVRCAR
jgi:phospholipase/carboxylesterase